MTTWTKTLTATPHQNITEYSMGLRGRWEGSNGWTIERRHWRGYGQHTPFQRIDREHRASTDYKIIDPTGRERIDTCSTLKDAKAAVEFRIGADARHAAREAAR